MSILKRIIHTLFFLLLISIPSLLKAQENDVEMADAMRTNGKIYVVVAVVAVVLTGLLIFLMIIDKKVRKLEKTKHKD